MFYLILSNFGILNAAEQLILAKGVIIYLKNWKNKEPQINNSYQSTLNLLLNKIKYFHNLFKICDSNRTLLKDIIKRYPNLRKLSDDEYIILLKNDIAKPTEIKFHPYISEIDKYESICFKKDSAEAIKNGIIAISFAFLSISFQILLTLDIYYIFILKEAPFTKNLIFKISESFY